MKKLLLFSFCIGLQFANAQCPVTVNGLPGGSNFVACAPGGCVNLTASGANLSYVWAGSGLSSTASSSVTACPSSSASYTLIGNSTGCSDTISFTINVSPTPTITASTSAAAICVGGATTLTATGAQTYTWSPGYTGNPYVVTPSSTTSYTVCGSDFTGCSDCVSLVVLVNPPPIVTFSMTNIAPQVWNATVTSSLNVVNWSWDFGDGTFSSLQSPSHTYSVAGWYNVCVTVTDANGCTSNYCETDSLYRSAGSMITLNVVSGTSGTQAQSKIQTTFYPNPASQQLIVESEQGELTIYDLTGKAVLNRTLNGRTFVDVSTLPEGIYMVKIKAADNPVTRKLVISR